MTIFGLDFCILVRWSNQPGCHRTRYSGAIALQQSSWSWGGFNYLELAGASNMESLGAIINFLSLVLW